MSKLPEWFGRKAGKRYAVGTEWCSDGHTAYRCAIPDDDAWPTVDVGAGGAAAFQGWTDYDGYSVVVPAPYPGVHYVGDGFYGDMNEWIRLPHRLRDTGERHVQARFIELADELFPGIVWWAGSDRMAPLVGTVDGEPVAAVMGVAGYPCDGSCCRGVVLRRAVPCGGWGFWTETEET